jgi:hypothetical protein
MESAPNDGRRRSSVSGVAGLVARVPLALAIVLLLGIELRAALFFAYEPATMTAYDTLVYVGMAGGELFSDPARTAGYSMLLRGLHLFSADVEFTIFAQHLLGIATALLFCGCFRRLQTPVWVAVAAAAGVLLSLDQIFLEHSLLSEAPFTFFLAAFLYAGIRSLEEPRPLWRGISTRVAWIALAGLAIGLSAWIRPVLVPGLPLIALWFAFAYGGPWSGRIGRAAAFAGAAGLALLSYAAIHSAHQGFFGITPSSGWAFYARTAEFADCTKFDPPPGTEPLCEATRPEERPGPDFYAWEPGSPARQEFGGQPEGNEELTAFARAAILAQPLDYLADAGKDSLRYWAPQLNNRDYGGVGFEVVDIDRRAPGAEEEINAAINAYYDDEPLEIHGLSSELADLQDVLRLQPWLMTVLTVFSIVGLVLARGRLRRGLVLLLGVSLLLLVIPPATAIWSARYAVPVTGPLLGAAGVGVWLALERIRRREPAPRPSDGEPSPA